MKHIILTKTKKEGIPLSTRIRILLNSFSWLATVYIPEYDPYTKKWTIVRMPWKERFACFKAEIETAIYGYWFKVEP